MPKYKYKSKHKADPIKAVKKMLPKGKKGGKSTLKRGRKGGQSMLQKVPRAASKKENNLMLGVTAGAVLGATVGGLAGAVLSSHNNRKVLGERLGEMAKSAQENIRVMNSKNDSGKTMARSAKPIQKRYKK